MSEQTFDLTDKTLESQYSGLSELPEVKTPMEWLRGNGKGQFREQLLDEVIPQRKELPDWGKDIKEETLPELASKAVFYDGSGEGMNKIGEFFYTTKDSFARAIENMPTDVLRFLSASAKTFGISEEKNAELLNALDDVRSSQNFDKALRDFRLGVESDAFSNEIADVFGQMGAVLLGAGALKGAGVAAKTAGGVVEGLAEGGEYLGKDIEAQRQREGGLEQYKGEGLGFATSYGILAGLIGAKGAEANFLDHLGEFTGKKFVKEQVLSELGEEVFQTLTERASRRAQNTIYGTDTDKQTWWQDLLSIGKAGLLGGIGGAVVGGVGYVNNHNRMKEMLVDNFGLTKTDASKLAWQYLEDTNAALLRNSVALQDMSPNSRVMQFSKEQLMRDGQTEEQADKTLARIRRDVIKEQVKKDEELSKNEFFEQSQTTDGLVEYLREKTGVQVIEDSVIEEEKQNIADRRAELESQQAETEPKTEQPIETQTTETAQEQPTSEQPAIETVATEETTQTQPAVEETTSTEQAVTEEKPTEQPKETPTPVQLELNFLNAQENAINQAMGIESPTLPVNEDMLTKQDIDTINNKIDEINTKLDELKNVKTEDQKVEYETGKELNTFAKPKTVKSAYAERIAKQTRTEGVAPLLHNVRDTKAAKQAADTLVENEENNAWEMLENDRADTKGFLKAEIAEALKRKIAKIQDPEVRKEQLRRLINAYSDVATRAGQELRALADDSLVDAIRDAAQIEAEASRKVKRAVKNKADKVQKKIDKVVKSNKVMSDKKLWDMIKEKMECK